MKITIYFQKHVLVVRVASYFLKTFIIISFYMFNWFRFGMSEFII